MLDAEHDSKVLGESSELVAKEVDNGVLALVTTRDAQGTSTCGG